MRIRDLKILEYNRLLARIEGLCQTSLGSELINQTQATADLKDAIRLQDETEEAKTISIRKGKISLAGISDVRKYLQRSQRDGVLAEDELLAIANSLRGGRLVKAFIKDYWTNLAKIDDPSTSRLYIYWEAITEDRELEDLIESTIDESGQVRDSASQLLGQLRRQIIATSQKIKQKLDDIIRNTDKQKMLQEIIITSRNDRYVIPVKQEYRGSFPGIIHDQSASGATLFIEPQAVVDLNNQERELEIQEKNEINRILKDLSGRVAVSAPSIFNNLKNLATLDAIIAKAEYAIMSQGIYPKLNDCGIIEAAVSRHPLLEAAMVVPIDISLGVDYSTIVITGPNTGGKTVSLKTIGLLSLMAASGIQPTAKEGSNFAIFDGIYVDIGDEQSIEQNLSTFSGHMTNIIAILDLAKSSSLVLLDELGAGTDPQEGAALAMAILSHFHERHIRTVATTHYSELKNFAFDQKGMINASVEFDVESLRPTYRLMIGIPGKSNALAIASRLGLGQEHIGLAETYLSKEEKDISAFLASLETTRRELEAREASINILSKELREAEAAIAAKERKLSLQYEEKIQEIEKKAEADIVKLKDEALNLIEEVRSMQACKEVIKDHVLIEKKQVIDQLGLNYAESSKGQGYNHTKKQQVKLEIGDEVRVRSLKQKGHIIEKLSKEEYLVNIGIMKVTIKASDLDKIPSKPVVESKQISRIKRSHEDVKMELDLRGMTIDEAIYDIEQYIDRAIIAGYPQVSLIHGKGTGALRQGVQAYIKNHPRVASYRYGESGEGGYGVTVIKL